jgi:hypothetical protein
MTNLLDEYLINIQEGVWAAIARALEFPTSKHPKYRLLVKSLNNRQIMCRNSFPGEDLRINVNTKWGDFKFGDYQEHPQYTHCLFSAYVDFLTDFLKLAEREKTSGLCKFNRNKEKCAQWVEMEVLKKKSLLKDYKRQLKLMKDMRIPKKQFADFQRNMFLKGSK